jgi:serine protease Do
MSRFVCVRLGRANGLDLSLFQFDRDLTFAVFFLNADGTIYGRFGTRSDYLKSERDISLEGLRKALGAALELHEHYPANREQLVAKTGPKPAFAVPADYPWVQRHMTPESSCMHCHHLGTAEQMLYRDARKAVPDEILFAWPMPDVIGWKLDPKEKATVREVLPGSPAAASGFEAGDEILTLDAQPMLSIADVQWVLHNAAAPARLDVTVLRRGSTKALSLALPKGWRRGSDISWRPTTKLLRHRVLLGIELEDLPDAKRDELGIERDALALHIDQLVLEFSPAHEAGFRYKDVIVAFDGQTRRMSESELLAYLLQKKLQPEQIPVTVLRAGERVHLTLAVE